jgi:hypothetical protein
MYDLGVRNVAPLVGDVRHLPVAFDDEPRRHPAPQIPVALQTLLGARAKLAEARPDDDWMPSGVIRPKGTEEWDEEGRVIGGSTLSSAAHMRPTSSSPTSCPGSSKTSAIETRASRSPLWADSASRALDRKASARA